MLKLNAHELYQAPPVFGQVAGWELGSEIENTDKWGPTDGILNQPNLIAGD